MTVVVVDAPVFSVSCGVPVTVTALLNVTSTCTTVPTPYVPPASVVETRETAGVTVSVMKELVAVVEFPAASLPTTVTAAVPSTYVVPACSVTV